MKSLNGHHYVAAHIDDATHEQNSTFRTKRVKQSNHTNLTKLGIVRGNVRATAELDLTKI